MSGAKMSLTVTAEMLEGTLRCTIASNNTGQKSYFFYLLRNGSVIDRQGWMKAPDFEWTTNEPGLYSVRGFCQADGIKQDAFSNTIRRLDEATAARWDEAKAADDYPEAVPFYPYTKPHADFIVSNIPNFSTDLPGFERAGRHLLPDSLILLSNASVGKNAKLVFSGSAFVEDRLVFGQAEAELCSPRSLPHSHGDFTAAFMEPDRVMVSSDYFGVQKLYYYEQAGKLAVSNRLHLLAVALRASGIALTMDKRIVVSTLAGGYTQFYQQTFSSKLPISGVKMLRVDEEVSLWSSGFSLLKKPISSVLSMQRTPASETALQSGLSVGASDILRQMKAVASHPAFENILVDATGGMDSRVVVAASSNLVDERDRIYVNACNTASIPLDILVACTMTDLLGLKFDDLPETVMPVDRIRQQETALSYLMGTYYAHNIEALRGEKRSRDSTVNVTGFYGEICLRPYYSRSYLKNKTAREADFSQLLAFLQSENRVAIGGEDEKSILFEEVAEALREIPGDSPLEKYDLHYLFFRNGLHCSDTNRIGYENPRIGIIQSKNLFSLKRNAYDVLPETRIQNDVISRLNSLVLTLPYASAKDNESFAEVKDALKAVPKRMKGDTVEILPNGRFADDARNRKTVRIIKDQVVDIAGINMVERARIATVALCEDAKIISKSFGLEIFSDVEGGTVLRHVMINKAIMLHELWRITQMTEDQARALLRKSREGFIS